MAKWLSVALLFLILVFGAFPVSAQSSLTIPGSIPTLAPFGSSVNSLSFPGLGSSPTPAPTAVPAHGKAAPSGFSPGTTVSLYLGRAGKAVGDFIGNMKLDGVTKTILLQLLAKTVAFLQAYNARIDPLLRQWLTAAAARLPEGIRGFTKVFIPFLAMVGKVILGVIAAIVALKLLGFLLKNLLASLFGRKRRRRK